MIDFPIDVMIDTRQSVLKMVEGLDMEILNKIPEGFNNNLIWNFGHIIVIPQVLCYKKSNVNGNIEDEIIAKYTKGTKPESIVNKEEFEFLKTFLFTSIEQLKEDYKARKFIQYNTMITTSGVTIDNIEKAIQYCSAHDNLHYGYMQSLKRNILNQKEVILNS